MEGWENGFRLVEKSEDMKKLFGFGKTVGVYLNPKVEYPALFFPGYPGAVALKALEPYETILTAPTPSFLSISLSNDAKLKQIFLDYPEDFADGNGGENNRFIAFLLYELSKGESSFWHSYLSTLPTDIEVLSDWPESDLSELQDEVLLQYSLNKNLQESECNEAIQQIFSNYPSLISPEHVTKVSWAWKVILTRAYGRCLPSLSLVPIADIFNHTNIETNYYYGEIDEVDQSEFDDTDEDHDDALPLKIVNLNYFRLAKLSTYYKKGAKVQSFLERAKEEDRKLFLKKFRAAIRGRTEVKVNPNGFLKIVTSAEGIAKGKQVHIQYGRYSNRQLLSQYGFAMGNNKYDYFSLRVELSEVYAKKKIPYEQKEEKEYLEFKLKKGRLCQELVQFLCAECWDPEEWNVSEFFVEEKGEFYLQVMRRYKEMIVGELEKFGTSLEEDLESIGRGGYRKHFALLYRIARKEILKEHLQMVEEEEVAARMNSVKLASN